MTNDHHIIAARVSRITGYKVSVEEAMNDCIYDLRFHDGGVDPFDAWPVFEGMGIPVVGLGTGIITVFIPNREEYLI